MNKIIVTNSDNSLKAELMAIVLMMNLKSVFTNRGFFLCTRKKENLKLNGRLRCSNLRIIMVRNSFYPFCSEYIIFVWNSPNDSKLPYRAIKGALAHPYSVKFLFISSKFIFPTHFIVFSYNIYFNKDK